MLEDHQMGSQTLEILRQGVWASLTGGWFCDPHQDVFCNTFHLYVWLFLLCLPFSIYVYFPPSIYVWYFYCGSVTIVLMVIKLINYGLHRMYDTTECIQEEVEDWQGQKKEEEGIELQVLSNKTATQSFNNTGLKVLTYPENGAHPSTDAESLESTEFQQFDAAEGGPKVSSTIDLKAEVHRKDSSESSDDVPSAPVVEVVTHSDGADWKSKRQENGLKKAKHHQRSKTDSFVSISMKDEKHPHSSLRKLYPQESCTDSQENGLLIQHRPSLQSVESEQGASNFPENVSRRHSNFTNSSLSFLSTSLQADIKPTGSLELGYIDKNPNQSLTSERYYYKSNSRIPGVRRIRSTVLETTCPPPSLTAHPNSLEIIGYKSPRNPLPPPSTSLTRNQHLNLYQYYGSEIVHPIAEQSDEHQTSQGPDTDLESLTRESDSDFEENNQGSHSPLIYIKLKKSKNVPYSDKYIPTKRSPPKHADEERNSTTSKDALLDDNENFNSNSSATPDMQDARAECYNTDNDISDRNLSCSATSVDSEDKTERAVRPSLPLCDGKDGKVDEESFNRSEEALERCAIIRKRNVKRNKRRKGLDRRKASQDGNFSCLVELDLDWLFENDGHKLQHRKEPLKRDTEWSSATTVSLEHDVSKVLQEPVPSTRSLGAIPKKTRSSSSEQRKPPKSESEKCSMCRSKPSSSSSNGLQDDAARGKVRTKENKVTQTLSQRDTPSPEDELECIMYSTRSMALSRIAGLANRDNRPGVDLSVLSPSEPLLSAFLNSRRVDYSSKPSGFDNPRASTRIRLRRVNRMRRRARENIIATTLSAGQGTHSAKNFNDTSDGSVHCFLDEHGNWITYTFDEKGVGTANSLVDPPVLPDKMSFYRRRSDTATTSRAARSSNDLWDSNSNDSICNSSISTVLDVSVRKSRIRPSASFHANTDQVSRLRRNLEIRRRLPEPTMDISTDRSCVIDVVNENEPPPLRNRFRFIQNVDTANNNNNYKRTKSYYKFKVLPWTFVKVTLDRLKLQALLDRNLTMSETVLSIILGSMVSILGAILLHNDFYKDIAAFIFCLVIASCQYSLLKSVQPDAASPTHGFNRIIAYSRPVYFCLFCYLVLILNGHITEETKRFGYNLNDFSMSSQQIILAFRDFLLIFILIFPIFFSLGLFPQINTFTMYLLEQIEMHIFGGNATCSLLASFYCLLRSLLAVIILSGLAYGGLSESKGSQHVLFSIFCACLVGSCYHLSRSASDPSHIWNMLKNHLWLPDVYREREMSYEGEKKNAVENEEKGENDKSKEKPSKTKSVKFPNESKESNQDLEHADPLPQKLQKTINARLKNDVILCGLIAILVFGIHASTVFTVLQPELNPVLWSIAATVGFLLHYIIPQLRKQLPWLCIARPILRTYEHEQYQIREQAKIMWFEKVYVYFCFFEKNILYPLLFLATLTEDSPKVASKYGAFLGSFIVVICGMKCLRGSYSDQSSQYLILVFTALFFRYDCKSWNETFLVEYFLMSIIFQKFYELLLKIQFVVTYIAPWQITWGSAFHAFAQPFSVPHSAMLFLQAIISAILSTPLNPFLGSAIFLTSYVRPVKFWERDYNTRRVDHSNTPLSSHLDRNLGADDNNLNSIFYEHLTRSLQHSLCGDLKLGRWGPVNQGDCFVLASDYLNCLVHIIEVGNDLVTFQMRGLEFRGTYCQQREVEAITEGVEENDGCCCCDTGHLPNMLSINAAFSQRWLAWEVTAAKYILEGYSISDNSAISMLQVFEFRKVLVSYYVKSIIFYTVRSPKLEEWLSNQTIMKALQPMEHRNFVDLDPVFNYNIDEDYDIQNSGMTRNNFVQVHGEWITFCVEKSEKNIDSSVNSSLVLLCFALSLLGRRTLSAASHNTASNVEFFLYGLHALFKGDFRITCARDEWVFTDMDLLRTVVAPGVRMSLKLHQDHFMSPEEYEELSALYDAICKHEEELVISHEGDPAWRSAVLSGTPSLLALRHVLDDGTDEYKIIMLNKRYLSFRVIKINKECVRGLWAGQQQELVYLRNRNPERGSIQNAKQALRNIINSSCDQPIGYPIYVSPLTTSYAETNEQFCSLVGGSVSLKKIRNYVFNLFRRIRKRCGEGCSSGAVNREEIGMGHEGVYAMTPVSTLTHHAGSQSTDGSHLGGSIGRGSSLSRTSLGGNRGSLVSMGKPTSSTLASLAGLFKERDERAVSQTPDAQTGADERLGDANETAEKEHLAARVKITDPNLVYDAINLGRRIDVHWPTEFMRIRGGRSYWKDWVPEVGMEGPVVHKWIPCHKDPKRRSHVDRTILLVQVDDKYVPIAESGVQDLGPEV